MQDWPYPLWLAHRGAGKLAPENTLAAFRLGASYGYRAFECDVKLSADGVPFLMHDATLERTTPERGVAGERPWSELSRLDAGGWHSRAYAGEPPPSLESLATWLLRNGFHLDLEIKPTPGTARRTGQVVAEHCRRLWAAQAVPPLLSSFKAEALAGARDVAPELPRALLVDEFWDGWYEAALELGCVAIIPNYMTVDAALVERARADGLRVLCYTVNDPPEARRLLAAGVAGLITDAVDRFSPDAARVID
ncbi:glycerophosphodiester phosphodiesterase [Rubrivivax gelatinosus]|uniref:Glycerophosphoryl diester phosphodiesterase n=1 Tax=Rubrivivax gelatinosus TaxID=28068 RepID=A0A4R2MEP7_RUBGE|nr:glycerophosphodiester phosphodiesterase [Rubrivivax gelatinosus]MBK1687700.1 glycerophosphodiester phosphodiesterase [Rubrivivax gelatinosus]TCP01136.1 glycerophosphoryl diester phosphodiesterase [Rubrivivax gelatinosus]